MRENAQGQDRFAAGAGFAPGLAEAVPPPRCTFLIECRGPDGALKWLEEVANLVTTVGRNHLLDVVFDAATQVTTWYLGLKGAGTVAAGDTLASHGGWSEVTPYSGNRPSLTWGTSSAGSLSASQVAITINAGATVAGAFICSVNTGTSGVLYNAADFAASRTVADGDTLNVTPTLSIA
jgi:hypothetical protein